MLRVGDRVRLAGTRPQHYGPANRGSIVSAPAPGLRRVQWDDGTSSDTPSGELIELVGIPE